MEPISSFAISIAAGIALDLWTKANNTVERELKMAFNQALKDWCVNDTIRELKKTEIRNNLNHLIKEPYLLSEDILINKEFIAFYDAFNKRICEYQIAYNYVHKIIYAEQFRQEILYLNSLKNTGEDTNDKVSEILSIVRKEALINQELHSTPNLDKNVPVKKVLFNNYIIDCEEFYLQREIDAKIRQRFAVSNLWIYGFSGIGKTALINRNLIHEKVEYIFCDCSPISIIKAEDVIDEIINSICEKYSIEKYQRTGNYIKDACGLLKLIENKELAIVIDELSIHGEKLFKEITESLVKLLSYHCNKASCSCLRFIISTIESPVLNYTMSKKAIEYFDFIEIDDWNIDLTKLLELIINSLDMDLDLEMKNVIISNSMNSPRLLKKIFRRLYATTDRTFDSIKILSEQTKKEYF